MNIKEKIFLLASLITILLLQAQGADKYTDGNRPYEFGFSIDGEQHRHEKKDEKGLIQGEFGFITADGVYHVTVYATDEQGRFKILSMKNIRVKPYPTYTAKQSNTSARQGHSLEPPAEPHSAQSPHSVSTTTTTTLKPISIEPPANSCSHCSLPPKPKPAPAVPAFNQPTANVPNQIETALSPKFSQGIKPQSNFFSQPNSNLSPYQGSPVPAQGSPVSTQGSPVPGQGAAQNSPIQPQNNLPQFPVPQSLIPSQNPQSIPQQRFGPSQSPSAGYSGVQGNAQGPGSSNPLQLPGTSTFPQQLPQIPANYPAIPQNYPITGITENSPSLSRGNVPSGRTPKRLDGVPLRSVGTPPNGLTQNSLPSNQATPTPTKPTLISAQMQIVDKNTDIHRRGPGENEGLPAGLNKDDMTRLLYTFNYTVGFHGHFEEGYANGVKQGYYFVIGRNGVRTRVDYVADSKGFRPKISQEVLDLLSDDVPKPETEKEEKYGLKGYEFKWLYYPVDSKKR